jgi:homoserine O-succinyltransferase/O-acetyltransferase
VAVVIDGGRIPTFCASKNLSPSAECAGNRSTGAECIKIALINNMPDPALEDTEQQFVELLNGAAVGTPVHLKLFSLPGVPRGDRGQQRLTNYYHGIEELWNSRFDAVIVTGTEPRQSNLRQEPYWRILTEVLDWAEHNTFSAILSCLAAHASVLYSDGIERHRLDDKQFGVFGFQKACAHALTTQTPEMIRFPHSRWNEVREEELISGGYIVLTRSAQYGVDCFVKKKKQSLFVHFQGHPEYGARTLLKEYRRDIRRFLKGERETYPSMPQTYFDAAATGLLNAFRERALSGSDEKLIAAFPEAAVVPTLEHSWSASARRLYSNWLAYVMARRSGTSAFRALTAPPGDLQRKPSVLP